MKNILGNIGIIGGTGFIGGAILKKILEKKLIEPKNLWIANLTGQRGKLLEEKPEVSMTNIETLLKNCDTIILAVRPQQFKNLKMICTHQLVISVMAGVKMQTISKTIAAKYVIRAMPNAALEIGESYTPWVATPNIDSEILLGAQQLFQTLGSADQIQTEDDLEFFTALTGSGQGWIAFLQSCLMQCAEDHGIESALATRAVKQLFFGMSQLINQSDTPVNQMVKELVEYAGTTAAGLNVMIHSNIKNDLTNAMLASYQKANSDMTK